jgi:hypothetical protein
MEVSGELRALVALPSGKESLVPIGWEAGWASELVLMLWSREKSLIPVVNQTLAIQPVAHFYTD